MALRRQRHYRCLLTNPPNVSQEDYLTHAIIQLISFDGGMNNDGAALLPNFPRARRSHFQSLVKFFSGRADFARRHSHYQRRSLCPSLQDAPFKTCCLQCVWVDGRVALDSEWHCILDCPHAPRADLVREILGISSVHDPGVADLARAFVSVRSDPCRLGDLARALWWALKEREAALLKIPLAQLEIHLQDLVARRFLRKGLVLPRDPSDSPDAVLRWLIHALFLMVLRFTRIRTTRGELTGSFELDRQLKAEKQVLRQAGRGLTRVLEVTLLSLDRAHMRAALQRMRGFRAPPWRVGTEFERPWPGRLKPPWRVRVRLLFRTWLLPG